MSHLRENTVGKSNCFLTPKRLNRISFEVKEETSSFWVLSIKTCSIKHWKVVINIDHFRRSHERKADFNFIKKSSLNYWPSLQVFNENIIHWKKYLLSNFNSTHTRITLRVISRILFKPAKVILGQSSRKIRYELCAAHLACIMAKDKLILVGGASGFIRVAGTSCGQSFGVLYCSLKDQRHVNIVFG